MWILLSEFDLDIKDNRIWSENPIANHLKVILMHMEAESPLQETFTNVHLFVAYNYDFTLVC